MAFFLWIPSLRTHWKRCSSLQVLVLNRSCTHRRLQARRAVQKEIWKPQSSVCTLNVYFMAPSFASFFQHFFCLLLSSIPSVCVHACETNPLIGNVCASSFIHLINGYECLCTFYFISGSRTGRRKAGQKAFEF